jgi:hypothetical protein
MFSAGSRYQKQPTFTAQRHGVSVTAVRPRFPAAARPIGYHRQSPEERLDVLAARYLDDPTGFWKICDANNTLAPTSAVIPGLLAIPAKEN